VFRKANRNKKYKMVTRLMLLFSAICLVIRISPCRTTESYFTADDSLDHIYITGTWENPKKAIEEEVNNESANEEPTDKQPDEETE